MQLTHLVYHHSKRITVRFTGWATIGTEARRIQQLRTHPTERPHGGNGSFRQENRAQVSHGHETEIRNTSGARVIDEDVRLLYLSVG